VPQAVPLSTAMRPPMPQERVQSTALPQRRPGAVQPSAPSMPAPPIAPTEETQPVREDEAITKARALLRAGRTVEQVARETGVEIGALRLMKQMTQRD